ncbi:DUF362 domain-containing protein [Methanorbis rubei]|uniref:4Fe-4S ferredoxin-type domain-containing protein n=1 Tax=Methanorbis rubei TaxID=3028300 RepID=A0AAE4MEG8_9EURY|nr:hypothetical protein [Methanocorpusculaceae archaeon Cs1]
MTAVGAARCDSYERDVVAAAVAKAVAAACGLPIVAGKKVLIKPNLLSDAGPDSSATTHPEIVYAVCKMVLDAGGIPIIADSPGAGIVYTPRTLRRVYERSGITAAAADLGIEPSLDTEFSEISFPEGKVMKRFSIIRAATEADVIISVCKLKTHMFTGFSGAVKNTFGVVPGHDKAVFHSRFPKSDGFSEMLVDLNELIRPDFVVMDAVVGMEGNGPMGGEPKHCGYVFASSSIYALDVSAQRLIGMEPERIGTTAAAQRRGLLDLNSVEEVGDEVVPITDFALPPTYFVPQKNTWFRRMILSRLFQMGKVYAPAPHIVKEKCIGCRQCVRICPKKAVELREGKAVINLRNCIRCYCCHEMCQEKAIDLKRSLLGEALHKFVR